MIRVNHARLGQGRKWSCALKSGRIVNFIFWLIVAFFLLFLDN